MIEGLMMRKVLIVGIVFVSIVAGAFLSLAGFALGATLVANPFIALILSIILMLIGGLVPVFACVLVLDRTGLMR